MTSIEGRFDINGSILIEDNATLILRDAVLNFTQSHSYEFRMNLQNPFDGNPRLIVEKCNDDFKLLIICAVLCEQLTGRKQIASFI